MTDRPALAGLRRRGAGVFTVAIAASLFGAWALGRLPSALYPEVSFPRVVVGVTLPGASAQTMQLAVSRPIEEGLTTIPGVRRVRSRVIRAAGEISVWFDPDADMDRGLQLVNAKLAEVRGDLPRDVTLVAERLTPSAFPILTLAVTGNAPPAALRDFALYTLRPRLTGLPGAGRVTVLGGDVRELEVVADPARLEAAHLDVAQLGHAVKDALALEAAGRLDVRYQQNLVVVRGPVDDPAKLAQIVVGGTPEMPVRLGDVAMVEDGRADRLSLVSADGRPAALVNVGRRVGADAVALADAVRREVAALGPALPAGLRVKVAYDQAALIGEAVRNVRDAVLLGGLLAVIVLAFFLRSVAATLVAAVALPSTVLMTFGAMRVTGASLNLMSLGGLAVAIGLVVDDAVVVVEAVHRRVSAGEGSWEATAAALREIGWPVVNSTLTTVVVFAPLSLLTGVAGQFFAALAFTLAAAVLISLAVALTVTPLLCGRLLRGTVHAPGPARRYAGLLDRALRHPGRTLLGAALAVLALAFLAWGVGTDFLPELDEGAFVVDYFAPTGTSLREADRLGAQVEQAVAREPEIAIMARRLGAELGPPAATQSWSGDMTALLRDRRDRATEDVIASARARVAATVPGVRVEFTELLGDMLSDLEGNAEPVEVRLYGSDVGVLRAFAPKVAARVKDVAGLADLYDGVAGCTPELRLDVDPAAAGRVGLSAQAVADQVRGALLGDVVAEVPRGSRLVGVRVRYPDGARFDPAVLGRLKLRAASGALVPLASVAAVSHPCTPSELVSDNLSPTISVTGRLEGRDLGGVSADVAARLRGLTPPEGVRMVIAGQRKSQQDSFRSLAGVLALAVLAVFVVMVFHFHGVVPPLLVLAAAPVAVVGGAATLRLAGVPLNVSSFMGCILLVGLVVKNGILLLDHAEAGRARGLAPRDAALAAAQARLRPILMTTIATLLGLMPLALGLGAGAELQRPLALAVIGGLVVSTALVLLALPVAYALVRRP